MRLISIDNVKEHMQLAWNIYSADGKVLLAEGGLVGYNFGRLKELGVGAILHDVGKTLIPDSILNKTTTLTPEEFENIQHHSQFG